MFEISKLLLVALGGATGAVGRFAINELVQSRLGDSFPWGTLIANLVGCFLMGLLVGYGLNSNHRSYVLFGIGFLGSLTTFSTFSAESLRHAYDGRIGLFALNVVANVVCCLLATWIGIALTKWMELGQPTE